MRSESDPGLEITTSLQIFTPIGIESKVITSPGVIWIREMTPTPYKSINCGPFDALLKMFIVAGRPPSAVGLNRIVMVSEFPLAIGAAGKRVTE